MGNAFEGEDKLIEGGQLILNASEFLWLRYEDVSQPSLVKKEELHFISLPLSQLII